MPYYRAVGHVPQKRHTQHRAADGTLYFEELMGEEGFSSDSSLLYHRTIPSAISGYRAWALPDLSTVPDHPLVPIHLSTHKLFDESDTGVDAVTGRRLLLGNGDVRLSYVLADATSPYYRNAIGDECLYVESGEAVVETVFGDLEVARGDYVVIPRATTHRIVPKGVVRIYAIEANSHITPPKRFLSRFGQLLEHAPYCERDLRGPSEPTVVEGSDVEVHIKHRGPGPGGSWRRDGSAGWRSALPSPRRCAATFPTPRCTRWGRSPSTCRSRSPTTSTSTPPSTTPRTSGGSSGPTARTR